MARPRRMRWIMPAAACGIVISTSCRDATEIVVEAHTNVPFHAGIATGFFVGSPGATEVASPTTESRASWGADGFVGSLAVVPGSADDAALSIKLVMGIDRDPRLCSIGDPKGCIFARRSLRYRPHEKLTLPVTLYLACKGVPCSADTTCNALGACVDARVTCDGQGCGLPGELRDGGSDLVDAPTNGDGDVDARVLDGSDASLADTGADSSGPTGPHTIDCPPSRCGSSEVCCWSSGTGSGFCASAADGCAMQFTKMVCDTSDDCSAGGQCCAGASQGTFCGSGCMVGAVLCGNDNECPAQQRCTGIIFGHYPRCQ